LTRTNLCGIINLEKCMIVNGLYNLIARTKPDMSEGRGWRTSRKRRQAKWVIQRVLHCHPGSSHILAGKLIRWGRTRVETGTHGDMKAMRTRIEKMLPWVYCEIKPYVHRERIIDKLINEQRSKKN
jgi:hypothetical protein